MDRSEKEKWLDKLLVFMNDEVEKYGHGVKNVFFNFSEGQEDFNLFNAIAPIMFSDFSEVMKIAISRKYVERRTWGGGEFGDLILTESGQGRAISIINQNKSVIENSGNINIGTFTSNGVAQIGHNNIMNIENMLLNLIEQIEKSDATEEQKKEAKSKLKAFIEHPLVNTLLGATVGAILSKVGL